MSLDPDRLLSFLGRPVREVSTVEYLTIWWLG